MARIYRVIPGVDNRITTYLPELAERDRALVKLPSVTCC